MAPRLEKVKVSLSHLGPPKSPGFTGDYSRRDHIEVATQRSPDLRSSATCRWPRSPPDAHNPQRTPVLSLRRSDGDPGRGIVGPRHRSPRRCAAPGRRHAPSQIIAAPAISGIASQTFEVSLTGSAKPQEAREPAINRLIADELLKAAYRFIGVDNFEQGHLPSRRPQALPGTGCSDRPGHAGPGVRAPTAAGWTF